MVVDESIYYGRELYRRLEHYTMRRVRGYPDRGSLDTAAPAILAERAANGFVSGGHFRGLWPRDLCFAAPGIRIAGHGETLRRTAEHLATRLDRADVFYTDFHPEYAAATPSEGVDTFPALVVLLDECGGLQAAANKVTRLAARHRERFFDDRRSIVTGSGSSWWDSSRKPREAYNTSMLLAAIDRLDRADVETVYTGRADAIRDGLLSHLWTGRYFAEHRGSTTLACDANVVPLYFGQVTPDRATSIVRALDDLRTRYGLCMRQRPFPRSMVHPFFLLHRDYHYHVWPWNSFMYTNGATRYGFRDRADRERDRVESVLREYGTFLEIVTLSGSPYVKRGYASAADFLVPAALWLEDRDRRGSLVR